MTKTGKIVNKTSFSRICHVAGKRVMSCWEKVLKGLKGGGFEEPPLVLSDNEEKRRMMDNE